MYVHIYIYIYIYICVYIYSILVVLCYNPLSTWELQPSCSRGCPSRTPRDPESQFGDWLWAIILLLIFVFFPSEGNEMSKSPPAARFQTIRTQTIAAFTSSTIHTADTTSCAGHERKGLTPSDRWAISHTPQKWVWSPRPVPALRPTAQCKQTEKGTHALCARTAPRVLRGSYPPVRSPPGSSGQWSFSSPGAHNGHPHCGPPSQGLAPPASADDGAATSDVLPLKASRPSPC